MIWRIPFRIAANGGQADAIGVAEVELRLKVGLPSITSINAIPSVRQISRKALPSANRADEPVTIARHGFRTYGVQRYQDMIGSFPETANPLLWCTRPGISYQFRSLAARAVNPPKDLNDSAGTRSFTSNATRPDQVMPTFRQ